MTREKMWEEFETGIIDVIERWKKRLDQEPNMGHWIEDLSEYDNKYPKHIQALWKCIKCKEKQVKKSNFCPNCGCRMVEPQESEKINCKATKCEHCTNHNYCDYEPQEKRCADCDHYGKLSLDCGRCDDDCSMFEPKKSEG